MPPRLGGHRLERGLEGPEVPEGLPSERPGHGPTEGSRDHARRVGVAGQLMIYMASMGPRAHARRAAEGRGGVAAYHDRRREVGPPRAGRCVPSRRRMRRLPPPCRRARGAAPRGLPPRASRLRGLRGPRRPRRPRYRRIGHSPVEGTQGQGRPRGRRPDGPLPGVPRVAAGAAGPSPGPAPPAEGPRQAAGQHLRRPLGARRGGRRGDGAVPVPTRRPQGPAGHLPPRASGRPRDVIAKYDVTGSSAIPEVDYGQR